MWSHVNKKKLWSVEQISVCLEGDGSAACTPSVYFCVTLV